jgi:hypothetical protein
METEQIISVVIAAAIVLGIGWYIIIKELIENKHNG